MSLIKIEHLQKKYTESMPLKDINAEINKGDIISIIGPSGTGKSTLLFCLNQLEIPTAGKVFLDGEEITDPKCDINAVRRKMGMVFQHFNLFNNKTVLENVICAPMDLLKIPRAQAEKEGRELLKKVGLEGREDHFPEELSGGQKQRVAIARAIAMQPEILMLDEPTSALDPTLVNEVLSVIRDLAEDGMTMLIVTHEMRFAREVSNRIFFLTDGEIYEEGTPEQIFEHPQREKTRAFIKQLRTLSMTVSSLDTDISGITEQLEEFGRKTLLSSRKMRNLSLVVEELIVQIASHYRQTQEDVSIHIYVEQSETENSVSLEIKYQGSAFDPTENGDELSLLIIKNMTSELSYQYTRGSENNVNQIHAII